MEKNSTAWLNAVIASHSSSSLGYLGSSLARRRAWSRTDSARMYSFPWWEKVKRMRK
jgi:hypothetical protein